MQQEARRFYARARECRAAAERSHDEVATKLLRHLADELESAAVKIEDEAPKPKLRGPRIS